MTTAFNAMLAIARELDAVYEGETYLVTGSPTTTTVISTKLTEADDYWNDGTVFITYDAGGAGAAPQNESREITDFAATSDTVTVSPAFSAAPAAGDKFAICDDQYPRRKLLQFLNSALQWWGDIIYEDDTSLDTAADTLEYTLPAAAVNDLRQVRIATNTSSPYDFKPFPFWEVNRGAGELIFRAQPPYVRDIRLVYHAPHAALTGDSSEISAQVYLPAIYFYAQATALQWKQQTIGRDDRKWENWYNQWYQIAEKEKKAHKQRKVARDPSFAPIPRRVEEGLSVADPS